MHTKKFLVTLVVFACTAMFFSLGASALASPTTTIMENSVYWSHKGNAYGKLDEFNRIFGGNADAETTYPDFVGGVYYNDEGRLVVQLVEKNTAKDPAKYEEVEAFLDASKEVIVEYVDYSENELKAMMDILNDMYLAENRPAVFETMNSMGVDTIKNRVAVQFYPYSEEAVANFKSTVVDSPMLTYEKAGGPIVLFNETATANEANLVATGAVSNTMWIVFGVVAVLLLAAIVLIFWSKAKRKRERDDTVV